ncbi:MAG: hypothetical protein HY698_17800 [Deltaproteobacteria bacterium]|nr:hypothetical protein [Deltaproteobacteria bacterium]
MTEIAVAFEPKVRARARRSAEAAAKPPRCYPARIARQLALAHALQRRVDAGEFTDYATMARALGFTRARVTQIMDLLLLAPDIQTEILFLDVPPGEQPVSERRLRDTILKSLDWLEQRKRWADLRSCVSFAPRAEQ